MQRSGLRAVRLVALHPRLHRRQPTPPPAAEAWPSCRPRTAACHRRGAGCSAERTGSPREAACAPKRQQRLVAARAAAAADSGSPDGGSAAGAAPTVRLATTALAVLVVAVGTCNRLLYRLALVPMRDHAFALALFQTACYCVAYFTLLALRYRVGIVTRDMLNAPNRTHVALIGACEAVGQLLMMMGAAHLPGTMLPMLVPTQLFWNLLFAWVLLRARPNALQALGLCMVGAGVALASLPSDAAAATALAGATALAPGAAQHVSLLHVGLCVASFAFPALATILKERIFRAAAQRLGGRNLDVIVINSFGSLAQALCVLALLPLTAPLRGVTLADVPAVLADGLRCLGGGGDPLCGGGGGACVGAPLLPACYVAVNVAFNILALLLVRTIGSVGAGLVFMATVPSSLAAFALLPLPLLPPAVLGPGFLAGAALLVAGLAAYNASGLLLDLARRRAPPPAPAAPPAAS